MERPRKAKRGNNEGSIDKRPGGQMVAAVPVQGKAQSTRYSDLHRTQCCPRAVQLIDRGSYGPDFSPSLSVLISPFLPGGRILTCTATAGIARIAPDGGWSSWMVPKSTLAGEAHVLSRAYVPFEFLDTTTFWVHWA